MKKDFKYWDRKHFIAVLNRDYPLIKKCIKMKKSLKYKVTNQTTGRKNPTL